MLLPKPQIVKLKIHFKPHISEIIKIMDQIQQNKAGSFPYWIEFPHRNYLKRQYYFLSMTLAEFSKKSKDKTGRTAWNVYSMDNRTWNKAFTAVPNFVLSQFRIIICLALVALSNPAACLNMNDIYSHIAHYIITI